MYLHTFMCNFRRDGAIRRAVEYFRPSPPVRLMPSTTYTRSSVSHASGLRVQGAPHQRARLPLLLALRAKRGSAEANPGVCRTCSRPRVAFAGDPPDGRVPCSMCGRGPAEAQLALKGRASASESANSLHTFECKSSCHTHSPRTFIESLR